MEPKTKEELLKYLLSWRIIRDGHWIHPCRISSAGYPVVRYNGHGYSVARLSAFLYLDLKLENKEDEVCHKNECREKKCWNPDHIYTGNRTTNQQDNIQMGKHPSVYNKNKTHCSQGHKYKGWNLLKKSNGSRGCRICSNKRVKIYEAKIRAKKDLVIIPPIDRFDESS